MHTFTQADLADLESTAKAIDSGLRQGIEDMEKGLKDTINKGAFVVCVCVCVFLLD